MKAMNRRKFLKGSLLGGAAASVISKTKNADASASFGGYPDAMGAGRRYTCTTNKTL